MTARKVREGKRKTRGWIAGPLRKEELLAKAVVNGGCKELF